MHGVKLTGWRRVRSGVRRASARTAFTLSAACGKVPVMLEGRYTPMLAGC